MVLPASWSVPVRTMAVVSPPRVLASVALASMVKPVNTVSQAVPFPCICRLGWSWLIRTMVILSGIAHGERWDGQAMRLEVSAQGHTGQVEMGSHASAF